MSKYKRRASKHSDSDASNTSDDDDFNAAELLEVQKIIRNARNQADNDENPDENKENGPRGSHKRARRELINNPTGLLSKLNEIALPSEWPWIETLSVATTTPLKSVIENVHNDLEREASFYAHTLSGVKEAVSRLESLKIPYLRPSDYFAEMVKPDKQVSRIKDSLLIEQKKMEAVEARKRDKETRKFAKQVQNQKLQEKNREKRENIESVRKNKKKSALGNNQDGLSASMERSTLPGFDEARQFTRKQQDEKREKNFNRKRERKDAKYGFGGKKKFIKSNDGDSTGDTRGFSSKKMKRNFAGFKKEKPRVERGGKSFSAKSKGNQRPGKNARQRARSNK